MAVRDPSCSPALYFLDGLGLACCVGVPDGGCVFKGRANKGFVRSFLCLLVADLEVAPEEAEGLVGPVCDGVDVGSPLQVVLDVDSKICCRVDVL